MWQEFKKFALGGSVIDMAIGVIIGGAFGKIVSSLVNDIAMPIFGWLTGGIDLGRRTIPVGEAVVNYGAFLQTVLDFVIVAGSIFLFIQFLHRLKREHEQAAAPPPPGKEEQLLTEIRDILKKERKP